MCAGAVPEHVDPGKFFQRAASGTRFFLRRDTALVVSEAESMPSPALLSPMRPIFRGEPFAAARRVERAAASARVN